MIKPIRININRTAQKNSGKVALAATLLLTFQQAILSGLLTFWWRNFSSSKSLSSTYDEIPP